MTMFKSELKKNNSNIVHIKDFSIDAMEQVLLYLYTGSVSNLSDVADKVLVAADFYQICDLKLICENYIVDYIEEKEHMLFLRCTI